jgi:RecB family exonuclease
MQADPDGALRAAIERALGAGEWPWPETLRRDRAFVDGIVWLASECRRCGVSEAALAVSVADEHAGRSALARLVLIAGRAAPAEPEQPGSVVLERGSSESVVLERSTSFSSAAASWIAELVGQPAWSAGAPAPDAFQAMKWSTEALAPGARLDADDVWSWPPPEEATKLVAPPMAFSASRLNSYVKCPRRWFFEYLCDAVDDEGSAAATYGKVFHEALEALHRVVRAPAEWSGNAILERLHAELDLAFERNRDEFASRLEFEVSRLKARAVGAHYARWLRAEAEDHPMRVEAVESLQRWSMGGHEFVGFIDRIDRPADGGPITIYDYKTGRIDEDPNEYLASIRRGEEAQLALYHAVRTARGDRIGRLALISLRDPRDAVWVLALDMTDAQGVPEVERISRPGVVRGVYTQADVDAAIAALLARADLLTRTGIEHFEVGVDPPCMHCAYAHACRERPDAAERVFAR